MKSKAASLFSGTAAALILLTACQQSETPTQSDTGTKTQAQGLPAGEGSKAAPEEIASGMEAVKDLPALDRLEGPGPLAKSAALATCIVDFNSVSSLDAMDNEASQFTSTYPGYKTICPGGYQVIIQPSNALKYKLYPEYPLACPTPFGMIGKKSGGTCIDFTPGRYWPRTVGNLGGNTGVGFIVVSGTGVMKNFNIQALTMVSGNARVRADRVGVGIWNWYPFDTPTRYYWAAGTAVKWMVVSDNGLNGNIRFDRLEISIIP